MDRLTAAALAEIRKSTHFSGFDDGLLLQIVERSKIEDHPADIVLFAQGEAGQFACLILSGSVAVDVQSPSGTVTVAEIGAGGLVGEIGAFAKTPRTATVRTKSPVHLMRIEQDVIQQVFSENPEATTSVIASLGTRIQAINTTIASLIRATQALAEGEFEPSMLAELHDNADRFGHFAEAFESMATELTAKHAARQEMALAHQIQQSFLPKTLSLGDHEDAYDVAARMAPAKNVGGDFYDYFMIDEDRLGLAVGDVSGKGVPAAMFMSVSRMLTKLAGTELVDPADVLTRVNRVLAEDNPESMFVTLVFCVVNLTTGEAELASGGHQEILVVDRKGKFTQFHPTGPAVGLIELAGFKKERFELERGATLVLATDGVTEGRAPDGAFYGMEQFREFSAARAGRAPQDLVNELHDDLERFADGGEPFDDITVLAFRRR